MNILNLPAWSVLDTREADHDYHITVQLSYPPSHCPHCSENRHSAVLGWAVDRSIALWQLERRARAAVHTDALTLLERERLEYEPMMIYSTRPAEVGAGGRRLSNALFRVAA